MIHDLNSVRPFHKQLGRILHSRCFKKPTWLCDKKRLFANPFATCDDVEDDVDEEETQHDDDKSEGDNFEEREDKMEVLTAR